MGVVGLSHDAASSRRPPPRRRAPTPLFTPLPLAALVLLAMLLSLPSSTRAHRPLLTAPVGGAPYSTYETALPVPWVDSSWSAKRVVGAADCGAARSDVFWMTFAAQRAGQGVHLTAGVPAAPGLAGLRPGLALFGPGLPAYDASKLGFPAPPARPGFGMLRVSSPADQSTCAFLENAVAKRAYRPAAFPSVRRCAFYEPFSKGWLWITADRNATLPAAGGRYYLASFLDGRRATGRYTVAIADWGESEDFQRPYAMAPGNRNATSWYDGAAAAQCCGGGGGGGAAAKAGQQQQQQAKAGDLSGCPAWSAFGSG